MVEGSLCFCGGVLVVAKAPDRLGGLALHGGYALIPCRVGFWAIRAIRLDDRISVVILFGANYCQNLSTKVR